MLEPFSPHKGKFIKHTQSYRIVEPTYEDDSHFIYTQLLSLTPVINIHQEINICVYSDLCWEQQLQKNITLCLDKLCNVNYKEAIDLEYK